MLSLSIPFLPFHIPSPQEEIETYERSLSKIQVQRELLASDSYRLQNSYQLEMGTRLCLARLLISQLQYEKAKGQIATVQELAFKTETAHTTSAECQRLSNKIDQLQMVVLNQGVDKSKSIPAS